MIEQLAHAMIVNGIPEHIRSDNGPELVATLHRSPISGLNVANIYCEYKSSIQYSAQSLIARLFSHH